MAERETTLAKNTAIIAIGSFASKLLQIVLVPFYTRVLTSGEFGTVDLLQAIVALLHPIICLSIHEGVFRYAMEKDRDKSAVLSFGVLVTLLGTALMCVGALAFSYFLDPVFVWLVVANTAINALWTLLLQYAKAIGRTGLYALNSAVATAFTLALNILFLVVFEMGITGYMLGYIAANFLSAALLVISLGKDCKMRFRPITKPLVKEMLLFSLPLLLNGICWWLSTFTDRVMIVAMLGESENGLYAAASKIPHILSVIVTIFYQAWLVSANQEFGKQDTTEFYSKTYEQNTAFTFLLGSGMILLCRPFSGIFFGAEFVSAWELVPPLVVSAVFFSFSQFLISIYTANKKTGMAFITNIVGTVVNVVLNAILIPVMGTMGAAIATAVSYFVLWLVRVFDTRKIVRMQYRVVRDALATLILCLQATFICLDLDVWITYGLCAAGTLFIFALYWKVFFSILAFCFQKATSILKKNK
ncbi:MAG: polysaccharide biosynthesis C-terminal domain-containing protein [Clostridia bacterium]|nr:polysaccharide biosynthesis C-terminal domain-containing protein [Clostridia bacterium]